MPTEIKYDILRIVWCIKSKASTISRQIGHENFALHTLSFTQSKWFFLALLFHSHTYEHAWLISYVHVHTKSLCNMLRQIKITIIISFFELWLIRQISINFSCFFFPWCIRKRATLESGSINRSLHQMLFKLFFVVLFDHSFQFFFVAFYFIPVSSMSVLHKRSSHAMEN